MAHNGNLIPNAKNRDVLVQSWYQGGLSVIDWTNGRNVKEIAWFDRGPWGTTLPPLAGYWSTYYYNGYIYGSEIQRGFSVYKLNDPSSPASRYKSGTLNAQTQFPDGKLGWGKGRGKENDVLRETLGQFTAEGLAGRLHLQRRRSPRRRASGR